jgi:hypothetical protein
LLKKCEFAIVLKDQTQTFTKFDAILSCWILSLEVALIPYLTAGDPDLDTKAEAMRVLDSCGCDIGTCEKNIRRRLGDLCPYKDHVQNVRRKRASKIR